MQVRVLFRLNRSIFEECICGSQLDAARSSRKVYRERKSVFPSYERAGIVSKDYHHFLTLLLYLGGVYLPQLNEG